MALILVPSLQGRVSLDQFLTHVYEIFKLVI